jgi:hypothetical protein
VAAPSTQQSDVRVVEFDMAEDADIRRENFRAWADKASGGKFSPSSIVAILGRTPSLWSDLYHGRKPFGEKLARYIEDRAGLRRTSLDEVLGLKATPIPLDLLDALARQPVETQRMVASMIRAAIASAEAADSENASRKRLVAGK